MSIDVKNKPGTQGEKQVCVLIQKTVLFLSPFPQLQLKSKEIQQTQEIVLEAL